MHLARSTQSGTSETVFSSATGFHSCADTVSAPHGLEISHTASKPRRNFNLIVKKVTGGLRAFFCLILSSFVLTACNWVDSTGAQPDDTPVITLDQGNVIDLLENQPLFLDPRTTVDPNTDIVAWRWSDEPIDAGNLPSCATSERFDGGFVADSIQSACVSEDDCELYFEEDVLAEDGENRTVFRLLPPVLNAPVGVTYQLFSTDASAVEKTYDFTFCLIPVNDEPVAEDDAFSVIENTVLDIGPPGPNLLSNDTDDTDITNQGLTVELQPVRQPQFARRFELFSDGGFIYEPVTGLTGNDSFRYRITDGFGTSDAEVVISVVAANAEPVFSGPIIPPLVVAGLPVDYSLSAFFSDPEGSQLVFSAIGLPPGLLLTTTGVLQGTVSSEAEGSYPVDIVASDGTESVSGQFLLEVSPNLPPVLLAAIPDQSVVVGEAVALPMAGFFEDPEGVELVFGLARPFGVALSIDRRTGVISGVAANPGSYILRVSSSDGVNFATTADFTLEVLDAPNRRPVYSGAIANQTIDFGDPITSIVPDFSDPDGDQLSFELLGPVPPGIDINEDTGVVSGTPESAGIYRNLAIMATDNGGLSANSDTFNIIVNLPTPNRAPVFTGTIPNQQGVQGVAIEPVFGVFSDPDGDVLEYSIVGAAGLQAGLDINTDGAIVGIPLESGLSGVLRIQATDPDGAFVRSNAFRINIATATPANRAPIFDELDDIEVTVGGTVDFLATATDADNDTLRYTISGSAAAFLVANPVSGRIVGVMSVEGEFNLVITVSDGQATTSIGIEIEVEEDNTSASLPNNQPTVTDIPNRSVTGSFAFDVSVVFTDPDGDSLSFSSNTLPPGLVISSSGIISGTASAANRGNHIIQVTANDGRGGAVTDGFRLIII